MRMQPMKALKVVVAAALGTLSLGVGSAFANTVQPDIVKLIGTGLAGSSGQSNPGCESSCTALAVGLNFNGAVSTAVSIGLTEPGFPSLVSDILTVTRVFSNGGYTALFATLISDVGSSLSFSGVTTPETGLLQDVSSFFNVPRGGIFVQSDANETDAVPVPPALALFGSALAGLGLLARKRKRTATSMAA